MGEPSEGLSGARSATGVPTRLPDVQSSLSLGTEGRLRWSVGARPPQGEEGATYPAIVLVAYLNRRGQDWSDPELPSGPESGVDFVARGPLGELRMQVTRVPTGEGYYRSLGKFGRAGAESSIQELADELMAAIRHKAQPGREALNEGITLLLDAQHSLAHGFVHVLDEFDVRHQADAVACGFREIWLVSALHFHRVSPSEWLDAPR